jgi:putative colanic acid biosynthesis acetyltransferase WcaF
MQHVKLKQYKNKGYNPGNLFKRATWYVVDLLFFATLIPFPSTFKKLLLNIFGAKVGKNVVIKPNVHIKYPWLLIIGDYCWIGEGVWIDNLTHISMGNNVVLSQGAYLLTGSHNYKKETFDLMLGEIIIEDGVWIGAKAIVTPGIICHSHSVLAVGSVATKDLDAYTVYQGNPAIKKRSRILK